jgi:hypothetical protein
MSTACPPRSRTADPSARGPSPVQGLLDAAIEQCAKFAGTFWLAAFPAGLTPEWCGRFDGQIGLVTGDLVRLPAGVHEGLGTFRTADGRDYHMLAFSLPHEEFDECGVFLGFARLTGATLVAHPPAWWPSPPLGPAERLWAAAIMFVAPASQRAAHVLPGGIRLMYDPWMTSVAALRDWGRPLNESTSHLGSDLPGPSQSPSLGNAGPRVTPEQAAKAIAAGRTYLTDARAAGRDVTQKEIRRVLQEASGRATFSAAKLH